MYYIVESGKSFEQAVTDLPGQAGKVLSTDIRLNMALPCRISVYTEQGKTRIGMIKPVPMLAALSQDPTLVKVAQEVEARTQKMIEESR